MSKSTIKGAIRFAATGVAVIFAFATVANAFQLEPKGPNAKWRSDIVKKGNTYTFCILNAWNVCEKSATTAKTGTWLIDCDITKNPVVGDTATGGTKAIGILNTAVTNCLKAISGTAATVGLSKLKPADPNVSLKDIGCSGDCGSAEGTQPCSDVEDMEAKESDPNVNSFKTAKSIGSGLIPAICGQDDCLATGGTIPPSLLVAYPAAVCMRPGTKTTGEGTTVNNFAKGLIDYTKKATICVQKCQDDLGTKAGGGFFSDGTECEIPVTLTPLTNGFHKCVDLARPALAASTNTPAGIAPACNAMNAYTRGLVETAINASTRGAYDRVDIQTQYLVEALTDSGNPFFVSRNATVVDLATGFADRVPAAGSRTSFGTGCPASNDGDLADYEECDGTVVGGNALCGLIPGTKVGACPTADEATAKATTGQCPR